MITVRTLIIRSNGEHEVLAVEPELDAFQGLVGGMIEAVTFDDHDAHLYCNEEGKLHGLPINTRATRLADRLWPGFAARDILCGDVIFLGTDGSDEADCPQAVIDLAGEVTA